MRSCEVFECVNSCTNNTECMIDFHHRDSTEGWVDCETFYEHMNDDEDDDDEEECVIEEVEFDCLEMVQEYVNADWCTYWEKIDSCTGESTECNVSVSVYRQTFEGTCDEIAEQFGIDMDDEDDDDNNDDHDDDDHDDNDDNDGDNDHDDDECFVECGEPFECKDSEYEWCQMVECYDHCEEQGACFAEWNDHNGEFQSGKCDDYYHAEECDKNQK